MFHFFKLNCQNKFACETTQGASNTIRNYAINISNFVLSAKFSLSCFTSLFCRLRRVPTANVYVTRCTAPERTVFYPTKRKYQHLLCVLRCHLFRMLKAEILDCCRTSDRFYEYV